MEKVPWQAMACLLAGIVLMAVVGPAGKAHAIDFSCPVAPDKSCKNLLYVSGEIVAGDAERFREEVKKRGPDLAFVQLWSSPGGNLDEAMNIGRLIRKLWMETRVASWLNPKVAVVGVREDGNKDLITSGPDKTICASACVFIWVAGVPRIGNAQLIIHRPYFDPKHFAGLSASDANNRFNQLQEEARAYLAEMNVGPDMWEKMKNVPSDRGLVLDKVYLARNIPELVPAMDEWTAAKCGRLSRKDEILQEAAIEKPDAERTPADEALIRKGDDIMLCAWGAMAQAHRQAWHEEFD